MEAKKKVLILSTIYPAPDIKISNNTNVVHYFAKEWVKQGYEVHVIHNYPIYLKIFHWIASFADKLIASKFNTLVTPIYQSHCSEYILDGVKIIRMPLFKPFPHGKVPNSILKKQIRQIAEYCKKESFTPDIITAHNFYPHLEMVNSLKEKYFKKATTCIVVHKQNLKMLYHINKFKEEIAKINIWGYRSLPLKKDFESFIGLSPKHFFMCYSGVPAHFLNYNEKCVIKQPIAKFIYVGSFIRRKFPNRILKALEIAKLKDFHLTLIGDGILRNKIKKIIHTNKWENQVQLLGFQERNKIPSFLSKAQCFIMISEEETFGLVYLEAMSVGCITIASKNEGMEGIIKHGVNGFLCKAGDANELSNIIKHIQTLSQEEITQISQNAQRTALALTDDKVATTYINSLHSN